VEGRRPIRIGIVGIGFGQSVLLPAFRADERTVVTALCATKLERARAVANREGIAAAYGDWRQLLASDDVDAIAVAVPPLLQPEIAGAAFELGKPVFCEKPLAGNVGQARRLLAQAQKAGVAHAVDFEFSELESWRKAKDLVDSAALGALRGFALTWHVETRANRLAIHSWKQHTDQGGGALASFGSHSLHTIEWMLGQLRRVNARLAPASADAEVRVTALCELVTGAIGTISIATDAVAGLGHRLEVHGSEGSILLENSSTDHLANFVLTRSTRSERITVVDERRPSTRDSRIEAVTRLVRRFVDAAMGGPAAQPSLEAGLRVEMLMDWVRESSRNGTWVQT
jgi:predicted dehydrogenase